MRHILIFICALALVPFSATGQIPPEAKLILEKGLYPCDGFRGLIDTFLAELREKPESDGLVVNIGREETELSAALREEMIRNHITYRGFDAARVRYALKVEDEFKTQFYSVPPTGTSKADEPTNYALKSVSKPVVLNDFDFDDLCPPFSYSKFIARILEQNPIFGLRAIVYGPTLREAREREKSITTYMTVERMIAPARIRTFLKVKSEFEYGTDPYVEYTIIP